MPIRARGSRTVVLLAMCMALMLTMLNSTMINVGIGHLAHFPSSGHPSTRIEGPALEVSGYVGFQAWRVRPTIEAKSALGGLVVTDVPATKPPLVSASERCP